MEKKKYTKDIAFACMLNLAGFVLVFLFFRLYFISNDDINLLSIMSGTYSGRPDAHLIYVMYPLGLLFSALYSLPFRLPYYEIFTLAVHFLCLFFETFLFIRYLRKKEKKGVYVYAAFAYLFFYGIQLKFIVENQYTVLAGIMMAAAVFYAVLFDFFESRKEKVFGSLVILLNFLFALWLRKEVSFMALPVLLLAFFYSYISNTSREGKEKQKAGKYVAVLLAIVFGLLVSVFVNRLAYSSKEWKAFGAYNKARTDVIDYNLLPAYYENEDFYLNEIGMDAYEYTALIEYNLNLVDGLDTDALNKMAARQDQINTQWKQFYNVPKKTALDTVAAMKENLKSIAGKVLAVVFVLCLFGSILFSKGRRRVFSIVATLSAALYFILFTAYFTAQGRLPDRVYFSLDLILIFFLFGLLVTVFSNYTKSGAKVFFAIAKGALALSILTLGVLSFLGVKKNQTFYENNFIPVKQLYEYSARESDKIIFLSAKEYASSSYRFFDRSLFDASNCINMVDWGYQSPLMTQKLDLLGISDMKESLKDENARMIFADYIDPDYVNHIMGDDFELLLDGFVNGMNVFKLSPVTR